ncbi:MAG TPA: hypothetical protein VNU01_08040, partial [Egibacteraceae bacterium]|nr:hypothetical protein [Egibacteraceae bacterium]
ADAAAAAADDAVAAAQRDLATATATVNSIQSTIAGLDADIAALEQELATTLDPVRLVQLPGEIAAKVNSRDAAVASLASAEAARASAASVLSATETSAVAKRGAAATARAALTAAESAMASAVTAADSAATALSKAISQADAAVAAAAAADLAVATAAQQADALQARLRTLLQAVSDLLEGMPPLPVLEQELDEALRAAPIVSIGGLALETTVTASPAGSSNLVHCKVERVTVLGLSPEVEECTDLIAMEKEAVRQVNELLQSLGAVGVQGVQLLGPGGTWSQPGPVGPDGKARSEGQMAALTLSIPEVSLDGVAANLLAKVGPILEAIRSRPASAIIVPTIRPADGKDFVQLAASGPRMEAGSRTLGDQIQVLSDELDNVRPPDELQNLSTGSVHAVVAQAKTVAEFDTTRMDDQDTSDPTSVCGGDPVCLAQCAAGNCPGSAAGDDPAAAGGGRGSGSDRMGLPWSGDATGAKLPVTGAAGGLTAVALLALGGAGAGWLRRRPRP